MSPEDFRAYLSRWRFASSKLLAGENFSCHALDPQLMERLSVERRDHLYRSQTTLETWQNSSKWMYSNLKLPGNRFKKSWPPNNDQLFFSGIFLWPGHGHLFCNYKNGTKGSQLLFFFANQQLFGNSSPHPASCLSTSRRRVSGLFRKTSRTFEHCFAALASLIVILALTALYDLLQGAGWKY